MTGLSNQDISKIVNRYIGVTNGYLGDFSYRTHAEFYLEYCNLDIDPYQLEGTTRERFISILKSSSPEVQSKILNGVLERFPVSDKNKPESRTKEFHDELRALAIRIIGASSIASPDLKTSSEIVKRAISDVEILLKNNDAVSGIDRIHTALHGYLIAICEDEKIDHQKDDSMAKLLKNIRLTHPNMKNLGARSNEIERILHSLSSILDALNPIRNNASIAHPNKDLLEKDEAMLVINVSKTIMQYLDAKIGGFA